jgi:hypothetical protein
MLYVNLPQSGPTSARQLSIRSHAVIDIVDSDDVVLSEIAAGLHLDQFNVDLARVGEAVGRAIGK